MYNILTYLNYSSITYIVEVILINDHKVCSMERNFFNVIKKEILELYKTPSYKEL